MLLFFQKKYFLFLFIVFGFVIVDGESNERGLPFVKNYSRELYKGHGQNWAIVQDNRGFIYFGNTDGFVLQYDGASWRQIPISNGSIVRSLAIDSLNNIYIGAQNDVGYLSLDLIGQYKYKSFLAEIDSAYHDFGNVWQIHKTLQYLFFNTRKYLFRRDSKGNYKIWKANTTFHTSYHVKEYGIYIQQMGIGLMTLEADSLVLAANGSRFKDDRIYVILPFEKDRLLIGTRNNGLFLYDKNSIEKFNTSSNTWLIENQLYHGIKLRNNNFVLSTLRNGIVILNKDGAVVNVIDKFSGLMDENVWYSLQDHSGSIWLALNRGIARIDYPSPFTLFDERNSLEGNVQDILRYEENLYAATGLGLYVLEKSKDGLSHPKFSHIPGLKSQCWDLLPTSDALLVSCNHGIFEFKNGSFNKITNRSAWKMAQSLKNPRRIYLGLDQGISSLYKTDDNWIDEENIPGFNAEARTIACDDSGNLWIGTVYEGVFKVRFADNKATKINKYGVQHGLPNENYNLVFENGNDIIFGTTHGIFEFDEKLKKFNSIKINFDSDHYFTDTTTYKILHVKGDNIWFNHFEKPALAKKKIEAYNIDCNTFLSIPKSSIYTFFTEDNGITWIGGTNGILRYDSIINLNDKISASTFIRRVTVKNNKVIFGGDEDNQTTEIKLPFFLNEIRFEFSSPEYRNEKALEFQYKLNGLENTWSEWNNEIKRDYTNLSPGEYTFWVRSKNIFQKISEPASYSFTILPPWYRTWWSYSVIIILFLTISYYLFQWIIAHSKQKAISERIRIENIEKQAEEKMRSKVAADFHDELGNRITKISLFSEILKSDTSKTSEKKLDYLNKINENANNLYNETRDFIWHLDPTKDTLHDLAIRLNTFGDELFEGTNINFEFKNIEDNSKNVRLQMDWRQHILRIFKEAMHNALKYSESNTVNLRINSKEKKAIIELSDDGKGFEVSNGASGEGLKNMKNRAEAIQSNLKIRSETGKGTSIRLEINLP